MGLDYHGFCFLKRALREPGFGRLAMIGRQNLHVHPHEIRRICGAASDAFQVGDFCEPFLAYEFGATVTHSFDASDYEGATFVADFNAPLHHDQQYDTVIDLGTTEHVFDVAQALRNVISLCKVGGQIIHVVPADNCNGHGFWQFSPELFFSLYSDGNGFADTEVFIAEIRDYRSWYKVAQPSGGARAEFNSRSPVYIMARTTKVRACDQLSVQQSDYELNWAEKTSTTSRRPVSARSAAPRRSVASYVRSALDINPALSSYAKDKAFSLRCLSADLRNPQVLSRQPPHFSKVAITDAIRGARRNERPAQLLVAE